MIEIVLSDLAGVLSRAEADDPESALVAARTLWADQEGIPYYGKLALAFVVDGALVRDGLSLAHLAIPAAVA